MKRKIKDALTLCPLPFALCIIGLFLCLVVFSSGVSHGEDRPLDTKGPVTITSSTLTADNKAHTALFEGSVVAKNDTMTVYSDRMLVYYSEGGKITKIEADGHVKLVKGERVITADSMTYLAADDKATLTGQPKAIEGNSMVTGTKMIYLLKEDRSIVENSKVFVEKESRKSP